MAQDHVPYNGDGARRQRKEGASCPLHTERSASEKPLAVPRPVLLELLAEDAALLQSVCNIYMQTYLLGLSAAQRLQASACEGRPAASNYELTAEMVFGAHHHGGGDGSATAAGS